MATIAFIGDPSISLPLQVTLEFNPQWGTSVRQHSNVAAFTAADYRPDAMVITDVTSDASRDLLNLIASMVIERIPTAVIAYHDATRGMVADGWGRISAWAEEANTARVTAIRERGEDVPDWQVVNPADTTDVFIVNRGAGIAGVLGELADTLGIPRADIDAGPAAMRAPFPEPAGSMNAGSLMGEKRRGGLLYAITTDKGGCGKTSTAIMLGSAIAYHSAANGSAKSVVVVDIDRQSQMRSHFLNADPNKNITLLKGNSTSDDVKRALVQFTDATGNPFPNMYALLGGDNNSNEHLAFRDRDLYAHVIGLLQETFDVVILDCSVGVLKDEVTSWAVQQADITYYILDQLRESLDMAIAVRDGAVRATADGGLGVAVDKFRIVVTKERLAKTSEHGRQWDASLHNKFAMEGTSIEGVIPKTDDVDDARDDCALVEVVQTSDALAEPIQLLAHKAFPTVIPKTGGAGWTDSKKRGLLRR